MLSTASQILILVRILAFTLAQNNFPNKYWEKKCFESQCHEFHFEEDR